MARYELTGTEQQVQSGTAILITLGFRAQNCTIYLTTERLVLCAKSYWKYVFIPLCLLGGPIGIPVALYLGFFHKSKSIAGEMKLKDVVSINETSHGLSRKMIIKSSDGQQLAVIFSNNSEWKELILGSQKAISGS